jgi:hypothetical protein
MGAVAAIAKLVFYNFKKWRGIAMEVRLIKENVTRVKCSNKNEKFIIDQLKFIGAVPIRESSAYTYFEFEGDVATTSKYLGLR